MTAMPSVTFRTVNLDCPDAHAMARFYGGLLGWEPTAVEPGWVLMRDPHGGTGLSFQQTDAYERPAWPEEPGRQQKMIHLELRVIPAGADGEGAYSAEEGQAELEAAVALALSAGGALAGQQFREDLRVVLDPAGHPLCLFLG
jgi:catechol 2,3-dioxygenase-like lactoylglutathione lyase family enzyme